MKLIQIKEVLGILRIIYNDRNILDSLLKYKIFKLYQKYSKDLQDAVEFNFQFVEQKAIQDNGEIVTRAFDMDLNGVATEFKGSTVYQVSIKSGDKECNVLLNESNYDLVNQEASKILNIEYEVEPVQISFLKLLESNISCEDLDKLSKLGVFVDTE